MTMAGDWVIHTSALSPASLAAAASDQAAWTSASFWTQETASGYLSNWDPKIHPRYPKIIMEFGIGCYTSSTILRFSDHIQHSQKQQTWKKCSGHSFVWSSI